MTNPANTEPAATAAQSWSLRENARWLAGQFAPSVVSFRAGVACAAVAIAIGFTHPVAMSLTEVLLGVMAFCWLLAGGYGERLRAIRHNPVALASLAMVAWMAFSTCYGQAPWGESLAVLAKYRNLVYLVLFVSIFRTEFLREAGLWFFFAAMTVTLLGSYLTAVGMPLFDGSYSGNPSNATVFRNHIAQGLCMSLFAYLMAHHCVDYPRWRWITGPLALAATWHVFGMLWCRTAYLTMAALIIVFCIQRLRFRGLVLGAVAASLLAVAGYFLSDSFSERVHVTTDNVRGYLAYRFGDAPATVEGGERPVTETSSGYRLEWYRFGMKLFAEHPILGVGVGNPKHYMEAAREETGIKPNENMHSEYVMALAQNGLIGLGMLGVFMLIHWRVSRRLTPSMRYVAQGALVILVVAGVFNSILSERSEGVLVAFCTGLAMAEYSQHVIARRARQRRADGPRASLPEQVDAEPMAKAA